LVTGWFGLFWHEGIDLGLYKSRGLVFKFSGDLPIFIEINVFLLLVNAKQGCVNSVSGVYLVIFSLLLIAYWSAGFGTFLQATALASHWLEDFWDGTQTARGIYQ
jgi:hypothetical protein